MARTAEQQIADVIASCAYDPLKFVMFAYPWGEPGPLANETGPDKWQATLLRELGEGLRAGKKPRIATTSGHGVGKSALVAWVVQWFISTRPHPQIIVTANTKEQLLKKTFRELSVWHKRMINASWFNWTATKFYHVDHPETWFANAATWSATNTEAFAGTHDKHVLLVFDEASGIIDEVWEVANGAMTTKGAAWLVFGNPTRNTGAFRECFGSMRHRWTNFKVDSRDAKMTDKAQLQEWVEDYGEDSDFVRVRVRGEFPRAATTQFIDSETVADAIARVPAEDPQAVRVLGADVARFGSDQSAIAKRIGARVLPIRKFRGLDTMQFAALIAEEIDLFEPDATFVDGNGLGAGVVDRLRQLGYPVIDVLGQASADDPAKYANKRAEMWGLMRQWLKTGSIPDDPELRQALIGIEYGYNTKEAIQLESKDDMKKRGLPSPDEADAVALGFAQPVRATRRIILPESFRAPEGMYTPRRRRMRTDVDWRVI